MSCVQGSRGLPVQDLLLTQAVIPDSALQADWVVGMHIATVESMLA
jgi:hypothetical protein